MDFRILGPLEVLDEGRAVPIVGSKQRALLALFLLHRNQPVGKERLIDELWGERPPATAAKTLQVHISRLRKALPDAGGDGSKGRVITREHGYELELDPERLDAHRFERLIIEGKSQLAAGRAERATAALEAALSLWRGPPLADLAYEPFAQLEIARLDRLRVEAVEQLIEAKLALGRHGDLVGQLEALIGEHPYRERLRAQLMLALYRCDRQADALQAYQDGRRTLVEELGIEPGERLRDLERAILAQDPALSLRVDAVVPRGNQSAGRLRGRLDRRAGALVGRVLERAELLRLLDPQGPIVSFVYGQAGVGKSALLRAFAVDAAALQAAVVELDGETIEPTEAGFLAGVSDTLGMDCATATAAAEAIGALGARVVVTVDAYERLRPLDGWLRATWLPLLPDHVRVAIAGRAPALAAWSGRFGPLMVQFGLDSLPPSDAVELLRRLGVPAQRAARLNRVLRGHPLALQLVASTPSSVGGAGDSALRLAIDELATLFVADLDEETRRALNAASVVRRVTLSLLGAMLPGSAPSDALARLHRLPFVWSGSDGLIVFHVVRSAIAAQLRSEDPATYGRLRTAARQQLRAELRRAPRSELRRYGADMLYLSESPDVHDAFFPNTAPFYEVGPARPEELPALEGISRRHEPSAALELLRAWWRAAPETFTVARAQDGMIAGYSTVCEISCVTLWLLERDPIAAAWRAHLGTHPLPDASRALCVRHLLTTATGEAPAPAQAALLLDLTRRCLELQPALRRIYTCARSPADAAPRLQPLGFRELYGPPAELDGTPYPAYVLDLGTGSADHWLAELAAGDLGIDEPTGHDANARVLMPGSERRGRPAR
jgi:DNA-binding SARP family transcriptional activator